MEEKQNMQTEKFAETADASAEPAVPDEAAVSKTRPSKKKLAVLCVVVLLCAAAAAGCVSPFGRYQYALFAMNRGNYAAAERQFSALRDYKDAAALCTEVHHMQLYQQAQACMDSGDYVSAYLLYIELGNYLDARELRDKAGHLKEVQATYVLAELYYDGGYFVDAYEELDKIKNEDYPGVPELKARALDGLYQELLDLVEEDQMPLARYYLELLEAEAYAPVEGLWERLVEEKHMELDTSYYDSLTLDHMASISTATTAEDYSAAFKYIYLSNSPSLTLRAAGSGPSYQLMDSQILEGADLTDMWLPEYASVYGFGWWYEYDGNGRATKLQLYSTFEEADSHEEAAQHIQGIADYCEEKVRMLNDELLLTNTMSSREKAGVILQ